MTETTTDRRRHRNRVTPEQRIAGARELAATFRRGAEEAYRRDLALASRWELFANLLEQGYDLEEANRRSFRRLDASS